MQDKAFDQLFRDKFEGAEIQPSADLWNGISEELSPKPKRSLPVYWMAAAVAVIVATIGLLMPMQKTEKIRLQAPEMARNEVTPVPVVKTPAQVREVSSTVADKVESTPLIIAPRIKLSSREKELAALQPKATTDRPVNKQPEVVSTLAKVEPKEEAPKEEVMIAKAEPAEYTDVAVEPEHQENKGIRNVGDLVNFVVNKVDKREKKFIQFDTNDDNSSLVSINIGFIKFNKKSDK
ncbi:hypothetical protein [Pedobacter sp. V48]|uniref:hypothetical protein n=1 Tax=Pedobacter sp. V48 TaxID=509635 RepID=UPI0003E58DD5|nr:hypothetical protein [Pedobacter sp. V48]ETZ24000.1 hypothetical protein N824_15795 [Pedobacter sp. V48]